jgi:hypothetical protein
MALGNTTVQSDNKLVILKIKTKTIDKDTKKEIPAIPHVFQTTEKIDGKWVASENYIYRFSGDLTKIDFEVGEWEGTTYDKIKFMFVDSEAKEQYLLEMRGGGNFRALANSILNLDPANTEGLSVSLYKTHSDKTNKDYSNIALFQGAKGEKGALVKGKFAWSEMPAVEKVTFKGKQISDDSLVNSWIIEKLKEFAAKLGKKTATATTKETAAPVPASSTKATDKKTNKKNTPPPALEVNEEENQEDIPFDGPR